jgi:SAM-dependent methyltransferase
MTVWNDEGRSRHLAAANWMAHTSVLMYLNERATGDPARDWLSSWAHRWFAGTNLRVLVLGCGEGWLERAIAHWPFVSRIDAVDFAEEAVTRAREAARGIEKIHYGVLDLNRDELPHRAYDVIVAHQVLHHVENLEHACTQIHRALTPKGTFIVNEYVGPSRFQYSDSVLTIMNQLLACLGHPPRARPSVEEMIASDPTEAVRSDEVMPLLERSFEIVERKDIGGTILQHLLYEIVDRYRFHVPGERSIVDMLCTIEAMLVDSGRVPCDFVIVAARKKGSSVRRVARPLPPRPEAANDLERDPLWSLWNVRGGSRTESRLHKYGERLRRLAILAEQPRRANLFRESRLASLLTRFIAIPEPQDPRIACLLHTAATLAAE